MMMKSKSALPIVAAVALTFSAAAFGQTVSKEQHKSETDRIKAEYNAAKARCDGLSANAKDICMAEAKGKERVAKAELDAREKGTDKARYDARVAKAEAEYEVAKERCDDRSGNEKDACVKDAKAALTRAKADAKADRKVSDARRDAKEQTTEARRDATEDKREADYRAARERCDALSGAAKDRCVTEAKARFGQS
jgi:hypothetical protein